MDGAPKGLKALGGTPESYYTTLIFFVISILLCFQAISDVAGTADEWSSMLLSLFFLVCASSWLCKQVRDRADVNNEMWEKDEKMTKVILFLARGTGTNVILCVTAFAASILLTLVIVWKSENPNFDSTLKLLITMGLAFMVIAAFYAAKTIRDNAIPGRVQSTDWMLAVGAIVFSVGFTFFALFNSWDDLVRPSPPPLPCRSPPWHHLVRLLRQGKSLGITLYTCLIFALASTFFLAKL